MDIPSYETFYPQAIQQPTSWSSRQETGGLYDFECHLAVGLYVKSAPDTHTLSPSYVGDTLRVASNTEQFFGGLPPQKMRLTFR